MSSKKVKTLDLVVAICGCGILLVKPALWPVENYDEFVSGEFLCCTMVNIIIKPPFEIICFSVSKHLKQIQQRTNPKKLGMV